MPGLWSIHVSGRATEIDMWARVCHMGYKLADNTWWRHQMEAFFALLAICAGNSSVTGALMFFLICAWTNGWVNNREAGDLRRHRAHYDVTVMTNGYVTDLRFVVMWSFRTRRSWKHSRHICSSLVQLNACLSTKTIVLQLKHKTKRKLRWSIDLC